MKNKKYHTVKTVPNSYRKIVEKSKIDTSDMQIHDPHFPGLVQAHQLKYNLSLLVLNTYFQQCLSLYQLFNVIYGGNEDIQRKPLIFLHDLTNFLVSTSETHVL